MRYLHFVRIIIVSAVLSIFTQLAPAQPVSRWSAEGNALDSVGNSHGTMSKVSFVTGESGTAFSFPGTGNWVGDEAYINLGNSIGNFGTNDFSISLWLRTLSSRLEGVASKRASCSTKIAWDIRINGGRIIADLMYSGGSFLPGTLCSVSAVTPVNDGLFHYVVVTRQGTNLAVYVDGTLDAVTASSTILNLTNTANVRLGTSACLFSGDGTRPFTGALDEIEIYNRALSTSEIAGLFNPTGQLRLISQPAPREAAIGSGVTFGVAVTGSAAGPLTYQWKFNGNDIVGATQSTYSLNDVQLSDTGDYSVAVSDGAVTLSSTPARLTVYAVQPVIDWTWPGSLTQPRGPTNVIDVDAGNGHYISLLDDGTVFTWGNNYYGQCNVPADVFDVVSVAAGNSHTLVLKRDGSVIGWGKRHDGDDTPISAAAPLGISNIVAIAAGFDHNLVLKNDGTVSAWGWNPDGRCDVPAGLSNVVAIAAGRSTSFALQSDGTVVSWGFRAPGTFNESTATAKVLAMAPDMIQDGDVWVLLSDGSVRSEGGRVPSPAPTNVVAIAGSASRLVWLESNGLAFHGAAFATNAVAVSAGYIDSLAVLGNGSPRITVQPANQQPGSSVSFHVMAIGSTPLSYQWQLNGIDISGATNSSLTITDSAEIAAAGSYTVVVTNSEGTVTSREATLFPNVIPGVFAVPAGIYSGLFYENEEVRRHSAGFCKFSITKKYAFSGNLMLEGKRYPFAGKLVGRKAQRSVVRLGQTPLTLTLQLDQTPGAEKILGTVADGQWFSSLCTDRALFSAKVSTPDAGTYTMLLPNESDGTSSPGGSSVATVIVRPNGTFTLSCSLSDNTLVSQSGYLSSQSVWPLFAPQHGGRGLVLGWMTLTNDETSSVSGIINWSKANGTGRTYTNGFTNVIEVVGSTLSISTSDLLNVGTTTSVLEGADLQSPIVHVVDPGPTTLAFALPNRLPQQIVVSPRTGMFNAGLIVSPTGLRIPVKGIVMQQQNTAGGFFIRPTQTGKFALESE